MNYVATDVIIKSIVRYSWLRSQTYKGCIYNILNFILLVDLKNMQIKLSSVRNILMCNNERTFPMSQN